MSTNLRAGNLVAYQSRVWRVKSVRRGVATIHAQKSTGSVSYEDSRWSNLGFNPKPGMTSQKLVAKKYGAKLVGKPFEAKCAEGAYTSQKLVWPERTEKVEVSKLVRF